MTEVVEVICAGCDKLLESIPGWGGTIWGLCQECYDMWKWEDSEALLDEKMLEKGEEN